MTADVHGRGLVDTNILILRAWIDPRELPDEVAISAVTLAELSAGPTKYGPMTIRICTSRLLSGQGG